MVITPHSLRSTGPTTSMGRALNLNRFNMHQPLYTVDLQWPRARIRDTPVTNSIKFQSHNPSMKPKAKTAFTPSTKGQFPEMATEWYSADEWGGCHLERESSAKSCRRVHKIYIKLGEPLRSFPMIVMIIGNSNGDAVFGKGKTTIISGEQQLNGFQRGRVIRLQEGEFSFPDITNRLGRIVSTVHRSSGQEVVLPIKDWVPGSQCTTQTEDHRIRRTDLVHRTAFATEIRAAVGTTVT
ncbi:hypothetical protein TNCV_3174551 [Trichonephila clavipes]|nr:hypothetical protein TNCV_3174551 [Trichonephila clavipes]